MFSGYNLEIDDNFFGDEVNDFNGYKDIGEDHLNKKFASYKRNLDKYINNDIINGSKIQEDWFPNISADIFISHSHNDKDLANALAGWLNYNFNLDVFIDSNVWGYSDELLESINSRYSNKRKDKYYGGYLYDHEACSYASQHVNLMLSIALQKMIDKVECVILLNTHNSINVFNNLTKPFDKTYSPWLYSEIVCTEIIPKKPLLLYRNYPSVICDSAAFESTNYINVMALKVSYDVSLKHLIKLNKQNLYDWKYSWDNISSADKQIRIYPLDYLYEETHAFELQRTKKLFRIYSPVQIETIRKAFENRNLFNDFSNKFSCNLGCEGCLHEKCPLYVNNDQYLNS